MSTEPTPGKTSEPLMLALHLGDTLVASSSAPAFDIVDGESRESYSDRFSHLALFIHRAILPLIAAANANAEEAAADYAECLREETDA